MNWIETWQGRRILLISSHPDDVAYSIGGLVACLAPMGTVDLVTVFTRSIWAASTELRHAGPDAVSSVRAAEDAAFCDRFGLYLHRLGFADSSLSGYDDDSELTANPQADARTPMVRDSLHALMAQISPDCVLAPAAIGGHIDHRIVHLAVQHWSRCASRIFYYEDLPYAAERTLDAVTAHFECQGRRPVWTIRMDSVMALKIEATWDYASQTDEETVADIPRHARRLATAAACREGIDMTYAERIWG